MIVLFVFSNGSFFSNPDFFGWVWNPIPLQRKRPEIKVLCIHTVAWPVETDIFPLPTLKNSVKVRKLTFGIFHGSHST